MFTDVPTLPIDPIMAVNQAFRADPREAKVDLIIGVYKNDAGEVPVMRAVKLAEANLLENEGTKTYQGMAGDAALCAEIPKVLFGTNYAPLNDGRVASTHMVGGSGALRMGMELLNKLSPNNTLWVSTPTWANHLPIAAAAGLTVEKYPYFRPSDRGLDFDGMMTHLKANAKSGQAILLHACCHNPTGVDPTFEQWKAITDFVVERGLIPLVDCAYQGLGNGMEEDVAGMRYLGERVPEMLVASSFSKNFGIYRERVGGLTTQVSETAQLKPLQTLLNALIRCNYSMPAAHGARTVATVLTNDDMRQVWTEELTEMRERISQMRKNLRVKLEERQVTADLDFITRQTGMFSYTGFSPEMVETLKEQFGIYMVSDGRINVAAISSSNIDQVAEGFAAVLSQPV